MKWPWVMRWRLALAEQAIETADELIAHLKAREAALVQELMRVAAELTLEKARYVDMAERALQMRKEGFEAPAPPAPPPEPPFPQAVEAAITERAVTPDLDRHLRRWAKQELTHLTPEETAQRILEGVAELEEEL